MYEVTNSARADWARVALDAFTTECGTSGELALDIKDLITDLLHLARREADVGDVMNLAMLAVDMHDQERREDPEEDSLS